MLFSFEIYLKHPETMETGWEIEIGSVSGIESRAAAIETIKRYFGELFDCIILCYQVGDGDVHESMHLHAPLVQSII